MMATMSDPIASAEAFRARSKQVELPRCDGLRASAILLLVVQSLLTTRLAEVIDLRPAVQAGFALTGFLLTSFLLRDRTRSADRGAGAPVDGAVGSARSVLASLPVFPLIGAVVALLYLPQILATESISAPEFHEWPALLDRTLKRSLADYQGHSFDGRSLVFWPLAVLVVPRRWLGLTILGMLGSGLTVQFSSLLSGKIRPAAILVSPSPLDLMAAGSLVAAIRQDFGGSGDRSLARWAILMGLVLAGASVGLRQPGGLPSWGSTTWLSAPDGFGAINFILKIMATTLVSTLAWRDLGH